MNELTCLHHVRWEILYIFLFFFYKSTQSVENLLPGYTSLQALPLKVDWRQRRQLAELNHTTLNIKSSALVCLQFSPHSLEKVNGRLWSCCLLPGARKPQATTHLTALFVCLCVYVSVWVCVNDQCGTSVAVYWSKKPNNQSLTDTYKAESYFTNYREKQGDCSCFCVLTSSWVIWGQSIQVCNYAATCFCRLKPFIRAMFLQRRVSNVKLGQSVTRSVGKLQVKSLVKLNVCCYSTVPRIELCGSDIVLLGANSSLQLRDSAESAPPVRSLGPGCSAVFRCD